MAFAFDRCTLALADGQGQTYSVQVLSEAGQGEPLVAEAAIPLEQGLPGAVMRSREVRLITDLEAARREISLPADHAVWDGSLSTLLSLPLQVEGSVVGALTFGSARPHAYDNGDVELAAILATHLALAIDRKQRTDRLHKANQEVARLGSFPELNPAAIIELDLSGQIHYMNPAAAERFPDCAREGLQSPLFVDLPAVVRTMQEVEGHSHMRELKIGDVWYQQVLHLVPQSERIRSFVMDITERKRAEEAVRQQNEYLAALHATTLGLIRRLDLGELLQDIVSRASQLSVCHLSHRSHYRPEGPALIPPRERRPLRIRRAREERRRRPHVRKPLQLLVVADEQLSDLLRRPSERGVPELGDLDRLVREALVVEKGPATPRRQFPASGPL